MDFYRTLSQISKLKRKELVLPIASKEVVVSPLTVGDDISLKTAILSPVRLDLELLKLLWKHTDVWFRDGELKEVAPTRGRKKKQELEALAGGVYKQIKDSEFYSTISYFDKIVLMWGIYLVTYGTLGEREFSCQACQEKFKVEMNLDDTLHEDSLTFFDEDVPFNDFIVPVEIDFADDYKLRFDTRIPSMADYNRLMRLISIEELQNNLEKIRSQFNMEQLMTLYTKKLTLIKKSDGTSITEAASPQEILTSLKDFVSIEIIDKFLVDYNKNFSKYNVNFYKEVECPFCKEKNRLGVDIEWEFFRRQLPN